jgi:hypothetical protein
LADGGERRILERRALNIVKAHHGNVIRHAAAYFRIRTERLCLDERNLPVAEGS